MVRSPIRMYLLLCLVAAPGPLLRAETYDIAVNSNSFFPNDLSIQTGDTVRWTLEVSPGGGCGYGYCPPVGEGVEHTVTADDGSFSSGNPRSAFVFEHVFDTPGEYYYHCEVHSAPGLDINSSMNGRIQVEGEAGNVFQINPGLNDAWFNPATAGQGFFITVFPDIASIFLAWFTYDTERPPGNVQANLGESGHRWLTAFGSYSGDAAMLDIELTQGGIFDSAQPMPEQSPEGTILLEFSDCNAALLSYDIASGNLQGEIPIQRIALDNVARCEAAAGQ